MVKHSVRIFAVCLSALLVFSLLLLLILILLFCLFSPRFLLPVHGTNNRFLSVGTLFYNFIAQIFRHSTVSTKSIATSAMAAQKALQRVVLLN